jgi:tetratricopeptide (TPR) repeat protein
MIAGLKAGTTVFQRLPGFFAAVSQYFRMLVLPYNLHMEYGNILFNWTNPIILSGALGTIAALTAAAKSRKSKKTLCFSIAWFFVFLLPLSNIYPLNAYMAEHWIYLPSIGFFLIIGDSMRLLYGRDRLQIPALFIILALVVILSYSTRRQNGYWKDPTTFYERTSRFAQNSPVVYNNLGITYSDDGRIEEAIESFKKALRINPQYAEAYYNLGVTYMNSDNRKDAIDAFNKTVEIEPAYKHAYNNLGGIYRSEGMNDKALNMYHRAIEIDDGYADAHYNMGVIYSEEGYSDKAIAAFKKAIEADPRHADTHNSLGTEYFILNMLEKAIEHYKKAVALSPLHGEAHNNLAVSYYNIGRYAQAVYHCDKAIENGADVSEKLLELLTHYRRQPIEQTIKEEQ